MNTEDIYTLFNNLKEDNLCFVYHSNFNDEITDRIIHLSETNLSTLPESTSLSRKVSFLIAECFQNVLTHGSIQNPGFHIDSHSTIFSIRNIGQFFFISSSNLISNNDVADLKSKLLLINNLDTEELKLLYLSILKNKLNTSENSGLGLIEMARRSGHKLDFSFQRINDFVSFFYIQIKFDSSGSAETSKIHNHGFDSHNWLHDLMNTRNLYIIHKGDFSNDTLLPIIHVVEKSLETHLAKMVHKRIFHLLVELLQNISLHGFSTHIRKEAIFTIGQQNDEINISTGNYIENQYVDKLKNHLLHISSIDHQEFDKLYKETLIRDSISVKGGAGVGLLDVVKECEQKIKFDFFPVDDQKSFFSISVLFNIKKYFQEL